MSTFERIQRAIADELRIDRARVIPEASIIEDLGGDSFDAVACVMALEDEFDIEISDDDAEQMLTVSDAVRLIDRLAA